MKALPIIAAKTHGSDYLLHKYWSRKPSNVVNQILKDLGQPGQTLIDPFCGSGVAVREGDRLGFLSYGFDVNPIATIISEVTATPPRLEEFEQSIEPIFEEFRLLCKKAYPYWEKKQIKYNVHTIIIVCPFCQKTITQTEATKKGRYYTCPNCHKKQNFNLENLKATQINETILIDGSLGPSVLLENENRRSQESFYSYANKCDYSFAENRRILAFQGMKTSSLFTIRNFSLLSWFADRCRNIADIRIRNAALLLLTASVAQCSRLIPYRNKMTTGGPAWSIPGFWVPPKHLETNPIIHLEARKKKFISGLAKLENNIGSGNAKIFCMDCTQGTKWLKENHIEPNIIFFDPPYGDSVPFLEFSQLWNSFLNNMPNLDLDLSVSDRDNKKESWLKYEKRIISFLHSLSLIATDKTIIISTFNNHDIRAWSSLIAGFQKNNMFCRSVTFQIPPVISSKAQFSLEGSYISDIYSIWGVRKSGFDYQKTLTPIEIALEKCANSRKGVISRSLAIRVFMTAALENNIHYQLINERDKCIDKLFTSNVNKLTWKGQSSILGDSFIELANQAATQAILNQGGIFQKAYENIGIITSEKGIGIPDPQEFKEALKQNFELTKDNRIVIKQREKQLELFLFDE